jgi:hypothetical protein
MAIIFSCCFREDESGRYGNAIYFECKGDSQMWDCSFLKCKELEAKAWGGIYRDSNAQFVLGQLNFSDCAASAASVGVVLFSGGSAWGLIDCTVVRCSGFSGLDDSGSDCPAVQWSNFYNNSFVDEGGCLFSGFIYGFEVNQCIFSGNTIEFRLAPDASAWDGFSVTNCVFSGPLPSGDIYRAVSGNQFETVTASFSLTYFATEYCPNPPLDRTPSESPDETPSLTPAQSVAATPTDSPEATASSHFNDSARLPHTAFHDPSPALEQSSQPDFSEDIAATPALNSSVGYPNSAAVPDSAPLPPTELCKPSPALKKSAHPDFSRQFTATIPFNRGVPRQKLVSGQEP